MRALFAATAIVIGCAPAVTSLPDPGPAPAETAAAPEPGESPAVATKPAPAAGASDDPRISRSAGEPGGVVLLWPRVVPADDSETTNAIADGIQRHMRGVVERALPGRPVDVRPSPERTCPKAGCAGVAFGALLVRRGEGCAVVAMVMPAGTSEPTTLVDWAGALKLARTQIPFRAYPESEVTISDFAACADLPGSLSAREDEIVEALTRAR